MRDPQYGVDLRRCVGSLPLGGMDDGGTLDLWDEGPQTERVQFVLNLDPSHMLGPAVGLKEGSEFLRGSSF